MLQPPFKFVLPLLSPAENRLLDAGNPSGFTRGVEDWFEPMGYDGCARTIGYGVNYVAFATKSQLMHFKLVWM